MAAPDASPPPLAPGRDMDALPPPPLPVLPPLSTVLPPIILGTATFNHQYHPDPGRMPARDIVRRAFELGIRAFDTSPYYGPAETLLGDSIAAATGAAADGDDGDRDSSKRQPPRHPRSSYLLITKAGRVGPAHFDYSPEAVTSSVERSLARLRTTYLDLVYLHDVEFVAAAEVFAALAALRRLQSSGRVRYVGISGYPVPRLLALAEAAAAAAAAADTSSHQQQQQQQQGLDAVLSYGHCTVQNTALADPATLAAFRAAGVDVVLNASILGMGLLTPAISVGPQESWHPAPEGLRRACVRLRGACGEGGVGGRLEGVAIRFALREWARVAAEAGLGVATAGRGGKGRSVVGATVIGVTSVAELEETMEAWREVVGDLGLELATAPESSEPIGLVTAAAAADGCNGVGGGNGHGHGSGNGSRNGDGNDSRTSTSTSRLDVDSFVRDVLWPILGDWKDYSWDSPPAGWFDRVKESKSI